MHTPLRAGDGLVDPIFEGYPAPTLIVDRDLRLLMVNGAARAMLGHEPGDAALLVRRAGDFLDCVHAHGPSGCGREGHCGGCVVRGAIHHAFTSGPVHRARAVLHLRRAGAEQELFVLVSAFAVNQQGHGRVVLTLEEFSDVVRLRDEVSQAKQASRENESLNRSLFDLAPSGVVLVDENGWILQFNEQAHRELGYTREEFARLHISDLDPDAERNDVRARIARTFQAEGAEFDVRHRAKSGEIRQVVVRARAVEVRGDRRLVCVWQDVTERKRAEEALRLSEERYRQLFDSMTEGFASHEIVCDEQGKPIDYRFLEVNRAFEELTGLGRDRVLGRLVTEVFPGIEPHWIEIYGRVALTGEPVHFDSSVAGLGCHFEVFAYCPGPRQFATLFADITERKQALEQIKESEERYRSLFELSGDAIVAVDLEGRFTEANPAALRMLGYAREELLKLTYQQITPGRWLDMSDAMLRGQVPARGYSDEYEKEYIRKDGTTIPISVRAFVKKDAARNPVGTWAIVRDNTERKRAEQELLERAEMAALSADVGMAVTQGETLRATLQRCAEAIVRRLDASLARIWVHGPEQGVLVLQASAGLYTHLDGPHGRVPVGRCKIGKIAEERKLRFSNDVREDPLVDPEWARREELVSFVGHPLLVGGKSVGVMAMFARHPFSDVALKGLASIADAVAVAIQRGLSEAANASLEEQFHQAQKLESVGRLAGGIAHDFNNLLTVILSGAEALKHDVGLGSVPDPEVVEEIGAAGSRARDLTRQLLAFARRQVIAPVPLDLNTLVRGSEKLLRRVLGEDVEFVVSLDPALWIVRCDPGQIEQVILNLAVNARDAMPSGGKLTIETSNFEADEMHGELFPGIRPGPYVRLAVHDSGIGMAPEVRAHVFEPFFTTKPVGQGTGLGLATVYGIISQSGGFIRVESEPGNGTTFEILFPRTLDPVATSGQVPPAAAVQGRETVLVVEDDPQVRAVTVRSLRAGGYTVLAASDGQEALELGARRQEPLHLLLSDVVMPGLDGRVLAGELRRRHPELRVLYVSGHTEEIVVRRGVLEPGIEFLPKPFTSSSLLARVRAVLDAR